MSLKCNLNYFLKQKYFFEINCELSGQNGTNKVKGQKALWKGSDQRMDNGESSYRRFLDGEDEAMYELICEYRQGMILYINSMVHNIHIAEDLAEDVFAELAIKRPKFSGKSSFKTWLYAIGRNITAKYLRRKSGHFFETEEIPETYQSSDDIENNYIENEQKSQIYQSLRKIKPEYSQIIYLSYFENLSNDESAVVMKKTRRQIELLLYRAKKALKINLERSGFEYGNQ